MTIPSPTCSEAVLQLPSAAPETAPVLHRCRAYWRQLPLHPPLVSPDPDFVSTAVGLTRHHVFIMCCIIIPTTFLSCANPRAPSATAANPPDAGRSGTRWACLFALALVHRAPQPLLFLLPLCYSVPFFSHHAGAFLYHSLCRVLPRQPVHAAYEANLPFAASCSVLPHTYHAGRTVPPTPGVVLAPRVVYISSCSTMGRTCAIAYPLLFPNSFTFTVDVCTAPNMRQMALSVRMPPFKPPQPLSSCMHLINLLTCCRFCLGQRAYMG